MKIPNELIHANKKPSFQNEEKEEKAAALAISTSVNDTEQKKREEYIGHLASIVESSDDAIISKSMDGKIKSWNRGAERMFGYTAEQAAGKHISLIIPPECFNEEKEILEKIRNNEIVDHYETIRKKKMVNRFMFPLLYLP